MPVVEEGLSNDELNDDEDEYEDCDDEDDDDDKDYNDNEEQTQVNGHSVSFENSEGHLSRIIIKITNAMSKKNGKNKKMIILKMNNNKNMNISVKQRANRIK